MHKFGSEQDDALTTPMTADKHNPLTRSQKLQFAAEIHDLAIWEMNIQNGTGTVDQRWAALLGYSQEEGGLTVEFWQTLIHPEDRIDVTSERTACINGNSAQYQAEYRLQTKDGHWHWILERGKIIAWDEDGTPQVLLGTHEDIQTAKTTDATLVEEKNKLEAVISALGDGLTVQDKNFRIIYQNAVQKERQGEHIGHYCYNAYQGNDAVCNGCLIQQCFADGQVHRREISSITPKGQELFMEVSASPVRDAKGEIVAGVETVRDITQRKLLEKQLQQAQKLESIGTLAGGIAHDFNNILSAIFGYAELVQLELPKDSELWKMQSELIKASHRAKKLVQQILSFSRRDEQTLRPLQLGPIVKESLKMLRASLPTTIEIKEDIASKAGSALVDITQVHQITLNLCTNAYHAMRETGGTLTVSLENKSIISGDSTSVQLNIPAGDYICLSVSDTGCGMDPMTQQRIFDPYYTTKGTGEGTGLGLSVVHGIIQSYNGHITVTSELNKGTSFTIFLPRISAKFITKEANQPSSLPTGTEHILFVDDEEAITNLAKQSLEGLGYHVTTTTSAEKALQLFSSVANPFDLIITDMTMPGLTGAELSQKILAFQPGIPIILCTGFSNMIDAEKAKELGIREMLMKPISRKNLAVIVRKVLDT